MKNASTGLMIEAPTGFSWTCFFFGMFVPLFRGMYGYAGIIFIATICTLGFSSFVFPFIINKHHVKFLIEKGYKPCSVEDLAAVQVLGVGYSASKEVKEAA